MKFVVNISGLASIVRLSSLYTSSEWKGNNFFERGMEKRNFILVTGLGFVGLEFVIV